MFTRNFLLLLLLILSLRAISQTANFSVSKKNGCAPFAVTFTDNSSGGPVSITKREWSMGGPRTFPDSLKVVYTFNDPGNHIVSLKVTFDNGTEITKTDTITVYPNPVASFTISDTAGCSPHTIKL